MSSNGNDSRQDPSPFRAALSFLVFAAGGALIAHLQGGMSWTRALAISPLTGALGVLTFGWRELIALFKIAPNTVDSSLWGASRGIDIARGLSNRILDTTQVALTWLRKGPHSVTSLLDVIANWLDPKTNGGPGNGAASALQ